METSAFLEKAQVPQADEVAEVLGESAAFWEEIRIRMDELFPPIKEDWAWSGKQHGWALRLRQKKRAVLYLTPIEGWFRVSFAFGERAAEAAREADLPASVLDVIEAAPRYPEGRAVRLDVRDAETVPTVIRLAEIKMAN